MIIDGDGVVDCPYDFDDKTNHENSNQTDLSNSFNTKPSNIKNESKSKSDNGENKFSILYAITSIPLLFILAGLAFWFLYPINSILFELLKVVLEKILKIYIDEDIIKKIRNVFIGIGVIVIAVYGYIDLLF